MSVGTGINTDQAPSPTAALATGLQGDNAATSTEAKPTSMPEKEDAQPNAEGGSKSERGDSAATRSTSSLLASLWSPFSSLLQGSKPVPVSTASPEISNGSNLIETQTTITNNDNDTKNSASSSSSSSTSASTQVSSTNTNTKPDSKTPTPPKELESQSPEAYYTPNEVPLFKALQKKRLSGTRTKQLLRAASRAYNDPPPPPELGTCCGSSCDPCVNDLWKEERDVWRERWGDRRMEGDGDGDGGSGGRKELEW
ncbi:hypothetical protein PMG11_01070 [Penicillium brasilianum]|nr:hypothetical protein PMG11_01070 [Penicillium brasilianum]